MTQQDKLIKQLTRVVLRLADDVDFLLGYVHEFGAHTPRKQGDVARRAVALRASADKLRLALDSKPQSHSRKAK